MAVRMKQGASGGRRDGVRGLAPGKRSTITPVDCWRVPFLVNNCEKVFPENWKIAYIKSLRIS